MSISMLACMCNSVMTCVWLALLSASVACAAQLLASTDTDQPTSAGPEQHDVLLRSQALKDEGERLYRSAVKHRLGPLLHKGYDVSSVQLGWERRVRLLVKYR